MSSMNWTTPCVLLPSASIVLSASMGSYYCLDNLTLATSSIAASLSAMAASPQQQLIFNLNNVDFSYSLIDEGTSTLIFTSSIGIPSTVDVIFTGSQWSLQSIKQQSLDPNKTYAQDPAFVGLGVLLDIDPTKFYTLTFDVAGISQMNNVGVPSVPMGGVGTEPTWNRNGWSSNIPSLELAGPTTYYYPATEWLLNVGPNIDANTLYNYVSCTSGSYVEWSIFCVYQLAIVPTVESVMLQIGYTEMGQINVFFTDTQTICSVFSDGDADSYGINFNTVDTDRHIIEFSADGHGNLNAWLDGVQGTSTFDSSPKTINKTLIGGVWYPDPAVKQQMNGQIARIIVFSQNLSSVQRLTVRHHLKSLYGF